MDGISSSGSLTDGFGDSKPRICVLAAATELTTHTNLTLYCQLHLLRKSRRENSTRWDSLFLSSNKRVARHALSISLGVAAADRQSHLMIVCTIEVEKAKEKKKPLELGISSLEGMIERAIVDDLSSITCMLEIRE